MLDIEHKSFLLCWSKSRVGYDSRVPELSTPKISDIHSTTLPLLNSLHTTHNGEFFIKLLPSFTQNTTLEDDFSVLYLMNSLENLLSDYGLASVECIKRIHLAYQDEITKWELLALLFLLEILVKPEQFIQLISPSYHRVYLTPIVLDIIGFSISILRRDRIQSTYQIPNCISSPSRMNMIFACKEIEVESLRAKVTDLESEIFRYQDAIDYKKHTEDTEQLLYSDILKVYLDAIFQLERKTTETNSLYNQIDKLNKEIISLNDAYQILKEQNLTLQDHQRVLYKCETEFIKLRQIQSLYSELQQTHTLAQENMKQLNDINHELRIKLSISEAKNAQSVKVYQELRDNVSKNIHLSEVLEDYEKEILKYKGQIAQRSISEQSIHFEQDKSFSLNDTSISIKQHETSNVSLYDDLLKLTHSREAEIHNLHSKLSIQSSKILSLKKQLEEASNQLSLKDDQLASYSKQIQDLQTFQHSIIKSPSTRYSLKDLSLQDAESDQKLNEYRRRSCIMNNLESPESFKLYPEMLTSSFHSKVTRLDIDPFCLESDMKGTILSPIKSVNCPSDFDSEVKEREISTIKEKPKRFWDTLDSVQK